MTLNSNELIIFLCLWSTIRVELAWDASYKFLIHNLRFWGWLLSFQEEWTHSSFWFVGLKRGCFDLFLLYFHIKLEKVVMSVEIVYKYSICFWSMGWNWYWTKFLVRLYGWCSFRKFPLLQNEEITAGSCSKFVFVITFNDSICILLHFFKFLLKMLLQRMVYELINFMSRTQKEIIEHRF